jgi:hypothetical protein
MLVLTPVWEQNQPLRTQGAERPRTPFYAAHGAST